MTISWASGNDYSSGSVEGSFWRFYIEREGPQWKAFDLDKPDRTVAEPIATGPTMRDAQVEVERQFEAL